MQDLGLWLRAAFTSETMAFVERLAGDAAASERALRTGFEVSEKLGEQGFLSTVAAILAHRILDQDRLEEAEVFIAASEAAGAEDDLTTQILLQSARGRALARRDQLAEAEELCRAAALLAEETDDINMRADVLMDLAEILRLSGDATAADEMLGRSLELFEAKGNVVQADALRLRLRGSAGPV
jgi:hypothetical protein